MSALFARLNVEGKEEILDLEPSSGFISPRLRVQRGVRSDGLSQGKTSCHYRGVVRYRKGSTVALSACDGLVSN